MIPSASPPSAPSGPVTVASAPHPNISPLTSIVKLLAAWSTCAALNDVELEPQVPSKFNFLTIFLPKFPFHACASISKFTLVSLLGCVKL